MLLPTAMTLWRCRTRATAQAGAHTASCECFRNAACANSTCAAAVSGVAQCTRRQCQYLLSKTVLCATSRVDSDSNTWRQSHQQRGWQQPYGHAENRRHSSRCHSSASSAHHHSVKHRHSSHSRRQRDASS